MRSHVAVRKAAETGRSSSTTPVQPDTSWDNAPPRLQRVLLRMARQSGHSSIKEFVKKFSSSTEAGIQSITRYGANGQGICVKALDSKRHKFVAVGISYKRLCKTAAEDGHSRSPRVLTAAAEV